MAVPKRKTSKSRRNKRRSHWKAKSPTISLCPQCHQMKLPHHICLACGYYDGKQVMEIK